MRARHLAAIVLVGACGTGDGASADAFAEGEGGTSNSDTAAPTTTTTAMTGMTGMTDDGGVDETTTAPPTTGTTGADTSTTSGPGTTSGGETSDASSSGAETTGGSAGGDYEPCNPDNTCDDPGEVCLMVGVGGFCTTTCTADDQCPGEPGGATPAICEFLLSFPDLDQEYCGMPFCTFLGNDCPPGMTCTFVVTGLTVCEWV